MTPRKAIIIVLIMFLAAAMVFVFLYINKPADRGESGGKNTESAGQADINSAIEKKNNNQELTPREQQALDEAIQAKVDEKAKAWQNLPADSPDASTQESVDFLLNPRKTAAEELGIKAEASAATTSPSQVKIDDLLNPSKK